MMPGRSPDRFRRLKPLFGKRINAPWIEYQTADVEREAWPENCRGIPHHDVSPGDTSLLPA